eukprot:736209-Pleurochrysis_carterae.AAC.1
MKRLRDYNIEAYAKIVSRAPSASTAWLSARARMCRQAMSVRALAQERNARSAKRAMSVQASNVCARARPREKRRRARVLVCVRSCAELLTPRKSARVRP